jgi:hypothetical protein
MDQGPLVKEEIEAGATLAREFDRYAPVKAAFWLKESDNPYRYLYLASDRIDDIGTSEPYGEVWRLATQIDSPDLDVFRVKLIGGKHPFALAAVDLLKDNPKPRGIRSGWKWFGERSVDDLYVYPLPLPAPVS